VQNQNEKSEKARRNKMKRILYITAVTIFISVALYVPASAAETKDVLKDIDKMASLGEKAESSLVKSVVGQAEKNPNEISAAIIRKLKDKDLTEVQLAVYIWVLGMTKDPDAVDAVIDVCNKTQSSQVQGNCLGALANIGGNKSGDFLLSTLESTKDVEMRYNILNLLGQMQYEKALPQTVEILKLDIKNYYWLNMLVFGKMGDKSVSFLIEKINDPDRNIRANAINVLGQLLISTEAAQPMFEHYWKETDTGISGMILGSLTSTVPDFSVMTKYFKEVTAREKNNDLLNLARNTLDNMKNMKADVESFMKKKKVSAEAFRKEYDNIYKSAGKEGDYEVLAASSTVKNEPELKRLRERILQRNSEDAFFDYRKINVIIIDNRLGENMEGRKGVKP
jgi:HEAT repeat protein